ncbi:SDH family Clp fold serine proteinase [Rhodopila sp.]|uniref:SDH family Clp fold serine proteinase n=1 Tax=Rhodopila sp. TaxID=2480087 RepID=UPI003D10A443
MRERKAKRQFPRTPDLPAQSSKYWAKEKDRYLRQLLINDIEDETKRELVVYFSRLDQYISETDADDLAEVLEGVETSDIDLLLHTSGGLIDSVEKFVGVLRQMHVNYRVIVPSWAKSGGTLIALSAQELLLGVSSELGPIDPQINLPDYGSVSAEFVATDDSQPAILRSIAKADMARAKHLANRYLPTGLLKGRAGAIITTAVEKLSSATGYGSHGAVIDHDEALNLELSVKWMEPDSTLWRRVWLLYSLYDFDTKQDNIGKITEGALYSVARPPMES